MAGCNWSLMAYASSADRSTAAAVPLAAGEDLFTGNGVPGTATQVYPQADGTIFGVGVVSETAAAVYWKLRRNTDANYLRSAHFTRVQTGAYAGGPAIARVNYPVSSDDLIENILNNAGAVVDCISVFISQGGVPEFSETLPPGALPAGAIPADFTATMTHVVDSWSPIGKCVFSDFNLRSGKTYKIVGMQAHSATGLAHRLRFYEGPDVGNAPGILGGDTAAISQVVFGNFGEFKGLNGVGIQTVAVAADATTSGTLWLVEV